MPPLYSATRLSATPPSNKRTLFRDCSTAWREVSFDLIDTSGINMNAIDIVATRIGEKKMVYRKKKIRIEISQVWVSF
jgi:hypothetical protein